ncbi:hypothetical protein [Clostridium sp. C8-1-8]|uniref:hypothetical protein n=1 Tax=Clostridium sp. C8-1-8 TaxID=2698831 RepID=UPI00136BDD52|nr:hypothetical protein [Clostridium sp. C8-1-8]
MKKINKIWQPILQYICTLIFIVVVIITYNERRDQPALVLQSLTIIILIVNCIVATIRYKKSLK